MKDCAGDMAARLELLVGGSTGACLEEDAPRALIGVGLFLRGPALPCRGIEDAPELTADGIRLRLRDRR